MRRFDWRLAGGCLLAIPPVLLWIFRFHIESRGRFVFGDGDDGRIAMAIQEHWSAVLAGAQHWRDVAWFYPWRNTLGYNEGFLFHGIAHSFARRAGADIFIAGEIAYATLSAVGFVAMALILRRRLGLATGWALLGGTLVCVANSVLLVTRHAQFAAMGPMLLICFLAWTATDRLTRGRPGAGFAWGSLAGALYGGLLLTSGYVAWAASLFVLVMILMLSILVVCSRAPWPRASLFSTSMAVCGIVVVSIAAAWPAVSLYTSAFSDTGLHDPAGIRNYSPALLDLISVDEGNLIWGFGGSWLELAPASIRPRAKDVYVPLGFTPFLFASAVGGAVIAWRRSTQDDGGTKVVLAIGIATALLSLAAVDFGAVWIWKLLLKSMPGATGFRVVLRMLLLLVPAIVLLAVWGLARGGWPLPLRILLAGLIVLEQVNWVSLARTDRVLQLARMERIPPAPSECAIFAVTRPEKSAPNGSSAAIYAHNVDAMFLAALRRLRTVNGMSSVNPPDWVFANPSSPDYLERVAAYADRHGLRNRLCGLDLAARRWYLPGTALEQRPEMASVAGGGPFAFGSEHPVSIAWLRDGWSGPEPWGVWSLGHVAELVLPVPAAIRRDGGNLRLTAMVFAPRTGWREVEISLGARELPPARMVHGESDIIDIPVVASDVADGVLRLRLFFGDPVSPQAAGLGADPRQIAIGLRSLEWRAVPAPAAGPLSPGSMQR